VSPWDYESYSTQVIKRKNNGKRDKGVKDTEVKNNVETMVRTPRSLGNQFPPKNPKDNRRVRGESDRRETDLPGSGPRRVGRARGQRAK
jgi:hypothetical protein